MSEAAASPLPGIAVAPSSGLLSPDELRARQNEVVRLDRDAGIDIQHHAHWRTFWTLIVYGLGVPSVALGAAASYGGLAKDNAELAGICALVAAVLTGIIGSLHAGEKRAGHIQSIVLLRDLKRQTATTSIELADHDMTRREADKRVHYLSAKRQQIDEKIAELGIS